jgi:multidrug efflux system membrane fusion protein
MRKFLWLIVACALASGAWVYFHSRNDDSGDGQAKSSGGSGAGKHGGGKGAAVPVSVATAKAKDISVYLEGLGNIVPRSTVTVHTLINGQLMQVLFEEGQLVQKDDLLAKIDDRPYLATLKQAEGFLARDQALLAEAKIDLERYKELWKQDSIAKQQLDTQTSLTQQYEGAVTNDEGQVDAAKTNLIYTKITSPVTGRVGLRQVDAGNIVHTTDTNGIVVVTELQPITAIFTIPEDDIPTVFKHVDAGEKLVAEAWDRDNRTKLETGVLIAIDNQVDPTTGTVKFRAEFANEDNSLFPSQFVNIKLKLDTLKDAVTVPNSGVQRGTHGTFVYLVKPDKTVAVQDVVTGPADGDDISVAKGVALGDQVVVDGADSLRDGSKIDIASEGAKTAGTPAPDKGNKDKKSDDTSEKKQHKHKKHSGDEAQ